MYVHNIKHTYIHSYIFICLYAYMLVYTYVSKYSILQVFENTSVLLFTDSCLTIYLFIYLRISLLMCSNCIKLKKKIYPSFPQSFLVFKTLLSHLPVKVCSSTQ